ncbi:MAG: T9SS type A sorting domain-containing protein [Lewinellaceae bacterium]|nr:T9SS type A sorting domain-containing protein [Lewinellaceae bacterium]
MILAEPPGEARETYRSSHIAAKSADKKAMREEKPAPSTEIPPPPAPIDAPAYDEVVIDGVRKKARILFDPETYEEKIEIIDDDKSAAPPPPGTPEPPAPRAGLLTAGEWNDLHNWNRHWSDLLNDGEIDEYQKMYGFFPKQRYSVLLTNEQDFPLADVVVQLKNGGEVIWETRTDNTGKAELWAGLFDPAATGEKANTLALETLIGGKKHELGQPKAAKDGINRFNIETECNAPKNVDIVWAVDATGSMGDEIEYLKTELLDVIGRAKGRNPDLSFRMGTVFYRDVSDTYVTKSSGLSYDISKTVDFIRKQSADGGGDYPEAVHSALDEAVFGQKWSEHAIARICFLVLDASPHRSPEVNASLQKSIREAARLGIRIVPVTASGIEKDTEFLMKFFGLATNGTYVFLTDHSGIGGKHLEPTTDEYKVEPLNELLVRLITEYTGIETCEGKSNIRFDPGQQAGQAWQAQYYPNPASTQFILDLPADVKSVTIYDSEGKAVRKLEKPQAGQNTVVVSDLSEGFYTIRILKGGQMHSGKLMVVRA